MGSILLDNVTYRDALHRVQLGRLEAWCRWLKTEGVAGYIGEMGWSNGIQRRYDTRYNLWQTLAEEWYRIADENELWVSFFGVDEMQVFTHPSDWEPGFWLMGYTSVGDGVTRTISEPRGQAEIIERHPETPWYRRGVNIATGQEMNWIEGFYGGNVGTHDVDWWYFNQQSLDYLYSRGVRTVRQPFRWERVQTSLGAALDTTYLGYLTDCLTRCANAGLSVILDCHNYGGYFASAGVESKIGSATVTKEHLADLWVKLSAAITANSTWNQTVVGYDIMNEPESLPAGTFATPARLWEDCCQHVLTAIRNEGDTRTVMIPGYDWSQISEWTRHHDRGAWITDSANNHMYTAHHYFDIMRESGTFGGHYVFSYRSDLEYLASWGVFD